MWGRPAHWISLPQLYLLLSLLFSLFSTSLSCLIELVCHMLHSKTAHVAILHPFAMSLTGDEVVGILAPVLVIASATFIVGLSILLSVRRGWQRRLILRHEVEQRSEREPLLPRWERRRWPSRYYDANEVYRSPPTIIVRRLSGTGSDDDSGISPCTSPPPRSPLAVEEFMSNNNGTISAKVAPVSGATKKLVAIQRKKQPGILSTHLRVPSDPSEHEVPEEVEENYVTLNCEQAKRNSTFKGDFSGPDQLKLYLRQNEEGNENWEGY